MRFYSILEIFAIIFLKEIEKENENENGIYKIYFNIVMIFSFVYRPISF